MICLDKCKQCGNIFVGGEMMKTLYELFWNSSLEELERGYTFSRDEAHYVCLVCGKAYEEGIIYETKMGLLTAERAMNHHIRKEHGDMLKYLLEMDKKYTGLSEIQTDIIRYFSSGLKDSEIAQIMEISNSTVINDRIRMPRNDGIRKYKKSKKRA